MTPRSEPSGGDGVGESDLEGRKTDGKVKIKTKASERLLSSSPSALKDTLGRGGDGPRGGEEQMVHISGWRFGCVNYKVSDGELCQPGVPADDYYTPPAASVNHLTPPPPLPLPCPRQG